MKVDSYSFGNITINGESYSEDVIIFPNEVFTNWRRRRGHSLCEADLKPVFERNIDTLIIGTGASGVMNVPEEMKELIRSKGLKLIILKTREACDEFNQLVEEGENVAAGLHLTC